MEKEEIEKLASEIEDVADPSSFEKVNQYYMELQDEAMNYMQLLVKQLDGVAISWEQPWYQTMDYGLTAEPKELVEKYQTESEKFRKDKMTKEERDHISRNWKKFIKKFSVPDKLNYIFTWKNHGCRKNTKSKEECVRRYIAAYLSRGLERTLHQVYQFIKFFHMTDLDKKIYTKHEQKIMEVCFTHSMDTAPTMLSVMLRRHSRGIYQRCSLKKKGAVEKKRRKWTLQDAQKLLKLMLKHENIPLDNFKHKKLDKAFWSQFETEMDRHYTHLNYFWYTYLHPQLFVQRGLKMHKLHKKLFKVLQVSSYKIWTDIKWDEVLEAFPDGVTKHFLHRLCNTLVRRKQGYSTMPLQDLVDDVLSQIRNTKNKKRLKRLALNEQGNLVRLDLTQE